MRKKLIIDFDDTMVVGNFLKIANEIFKETKKIQDLQSYYVEDNFDVTDESLYLLLIILTDGEHPALYAIPASAWNRTEPPFVFHNYEGKKSEPEYGLNLSKKNLPQIDQYRIEKMIDMF